MATMPASLEIELDWTARRLRTTLYSVEATSPASFILVRCSVGGLLASELLRIGASIGDDQPATQE